MATTKRKLLAGMCLILLLQVPAVVFGEGSGFFFNGQVLYDLEPTFSNSKTKYGNQVGIVGGLLGIGAAFYHFELSANGGYSLRNWFREVPETNPLTGEVLIRYEAAKNHEFPVFLKFAGRIGLGNSFMLKPNLTAGMLFSLAPDIDMTMALKAGGGLDFAFSFPGDKISLFIGADFNVTTSLSDIASFDLWLMSPSVRAGVVLYPFSQNKNKIKKPSVGVRKTDPAPSDAKSEPESAYTAPNGNVFLAAVRGENRDTPPSQTVTAAVPRGGAQDAPPPRSSIDILSGIIEVRDDIAAINTELSSLEGSISDYEKVLNTLRISTAAAVSGGYSNTELEGETTIVSYFPNITAPVVKYSLPTIDEVGRQLQANPGMKAVIQGYSAPGKSEDDEKIISETRARYCAEYLNQNYGIAYNRLTVGWYGSAPKSGISAEVIVLAN